MIIDVFNLQPFSGTRFFCIPSFRLHLGSSNIPLGSVSSVYLFYFKDGGDNPAIKTFPHSIAASRLFILSFVPVIKTFLEHPL